MVNSRHIAKQTGACASAQAHKFAELERLLFSCAYNESQEARHEWWCLWRLLCHSKVRFKIKFPAKIEKRDPPDFLMHHGRQNIELEITKATFQRYEQIKKRFRGVEARAVLELDPSLFSNRMLKSRDGPDAWRQYVRNPEDGLIGRGWARNEPEESLAEAIKSALARKLVASRNPCPAAGAWLFVDASDHFPGIHVKTVCDLVQGELLSALNRFDLVAVDFGTKGIYFWDRRMRAAGPPDA
jgi:hypothetical protein